MRVWGPDVQLKKDLILEEYKKGVSIKELQEKYQTPHDYVLRICRIAEMYKSYVGAFCFAWYHINDLSETEAEEIEYYLKKNDLCLDDIKKLQSITFSQILEEYNMTIQEFSDFFHIARVTCIRWYQRDKILKESYRCLLMMLLSMPTAFYQFKTYNFENSLTPRHLLMELNMTYLEFSQCFCVPMTTVANWFSERVIMPTGIRYIISYLIQRYPHLISGR